MLSVAEALARVVALMRPTDIETAPLSQAGGRVMAEPAYAARDQPPFDTTAMDGYAVRAADAVEGARLRVIGASRAGERFTGAVGPGEAARIFTGAPMPDGADAVVMQENAERDGDHMRVRVPARRGEFLRPRGLDFAAGRALHPQRRLRSGDVALLAAMNVPEIRVRRRPRIALVATGDELVEPGETPGPDQIVSSNNFGLAALFASLGAEPILAPIARDDRASLDAALAAAQGADLIVTIGGASVGEHDLVRDAIGEGDLAFYKVAMRPGKPLMAGRVRGVPMVGLPGNPVSALVCGHVFLRPALDAMLGLPAAPLQRHPARLQGRIEAGGPREHYMRARLFHGPDGATAQPFDAQDSAMLGNLAAADCLIVRAPNAPAEQDGAIVEIIPLDA